MRWGYTLKVGKLWEKSHMEHNILMNYGTVNEFVEVFYVF